MRCREGEGEDNRTMRWWIVAQHESQSDDPKESWRLDSHIEALEVYEHFCRSYRCVWLAEYGRYKASDKMIEDWVWYKWTTGCDWEEPKGRFSGWPENDLDLWVADYTAIHRSGARVAGV